MNNISDKGTKNSLAHESYLKGQAHLRLWTPDDLVAALELFERALELDPEFSQSYTALATAYWNNILGGREYFAKTGKEYFESKILIRHYINLSMENPTPKTYGHLAVLELQRRKFDQAILYANKALLLAPNDADILRTVGLILVFTGQPDKAIYHIDKSMNLDPLNRALGAKASAYFVLGKYEEAANCFEKKLDIDNTNFKIWSDLGTFYLEFGKNLRAIKYIEKAIELAPNEAALWFNLGIAYASLERYENSIAAYKKSIELNPELSSAWCNLGLVYSQAGDEQKSLECSKKAVQLNQNEKYAWNNLGSTHNKLGKYHEAIDYLKKSLKVDPENDVPWQNMGNSYFELKDYKKAVECYEKSLNLKIKYRKDVSLVKDLLQKAKKKLNES